MCFNGNQGVLKGTRSLFQWVQQRVSDFLQLVWGSATCFRGIAQRILGSSAMKFWACLEGDTSDFRCGCYWFSELHAVVLREVTALNKEENRTTRRRE